MPSLKNNNLPPGNVGQQSKSSFYFSRLASLQVDKQKCQTEWHKLFSSWEHQVLSKYDLDITIFCIALYSNLPAFFFQSNNTKIISIRENNLINQHVIVCKSYQIFPLSIWTSWKAGSQIPISFILMTFWIPFTYLNREQQQLQSQSQDPYASV